MSPLRGKALVLYCVCCLVWGSTWAVIKVGLQDLPPLFFAGLRMLLACVILTPLALRHGLLQVDRRALRAIALAGFLQIGLSYACVFTAEQTIDSGLTAVLFATFPIWVALLAHWLLPDEPLTPARASAALLGVAGIGVLEAPALQRTSLGGAALWAALLPVASAVVSAISNVVVKKRLGAVSPAANLWGQTLVGSAVLLALAARFESGIEPVWSARAVGALLYLVVFGTVVTFLCLFWLIPRVSMASIGAIPLIDTAIAVVTGALVLGEGLGLRALAGSALVLAGAGLAALAPRATATSG